MLGAGALAAAAWLGWPRGAGAPQPPAVHALPAVHAPPPLRALLPEPALPAAPGGDLAAWRAERSSLRGTQLDGQWGLDPHGQLQPTLALRRRFDHLLLLRDGEADVATLSQFIRHEVAVAAGTAAAQQVLDIWHRYVALLDTRFATRVDMNRPETWGPALAERQRARRDHLGLAWANAFYGEEEAALQALINNGAAGSAARAAAAPASGVVVLGLQGLAREALDPQQRERLDALDAEQMRWDERLAEARRAIDALRGAAHLSPPQRREAIESWLVQHFDAQEQLRIRGLLELPPPGTR